MDDEDGDFSLSTAARSRLSSLFQGDNPSGDVNQALTFTAPKQPRKNENPQNSSETFKLLTAAVVHAYKLKGGSYENQGKLGCAILGLHETSSYKFLLYKGKQIQVTACSIVPSFKFHIQPNNYVNFFDEKNENWSINFESEATLTDFAKQVALAKANSEGKAKSSLVVQDLLLGEGPSLDSGDAAELRYSCWSLANCSFGQLLDSNMKSESSFRLRLGKSKIIKGLSDGLVGTQKGTRRLLIIPANLNTEGTSPPVPLNTTVIFEILVLKVKVSRESSHSPSPIKVPESASDRKPELLPRPSIGQEDNIRSRGASISEQLSQSPKRDRAQIISRMAKMGTATLPFQGAVAAHVSSGSENEEDVPPEEPVTSRTASPKSFAKPGSRKDSASSVASQPPPPQLVPESVALQVTQQSSQMAVSSQVALPTQQAFVTPSPTMSFSAYQTAFPAPFPMHGLPAMMPTSVADTHLPMLITETRGQNTEVRLSLSKITDKVDTVIQKVDELRSQRMGGMAQAPFMDSAMLVQNIERIVQENKQLKEDVEAKNSKIQSLNEKICDLFQRNQRFFEESSTLLEQRSDSMQAVSAQAQAKLLSLEKEKAKLSSDLLDATSKLAATEGGLNKSRSLENQLKQRLQEYEETIERQSTEGHLEKESLVASLQQKVKNSDHEKEMLTRQLSDLEARCNHLSESNTSLEKLLVEKESKLDEIKTGTENDLKKSHEEEIRRYQEKLRQLSEELKMSEAAGEKKRLDDLQLERESSSAWKKKYEVFYERTRAMKEQYEGRMGQMAAEIKQLRAATSTPASAHFSGELKKAMNALFKILQGRFEPDASYQGSKVLELTLQSIRVLTFQMLDMKTRADSGNEAESGKAVSEAAETCSTDPTAQENGLGETSSNPPAAEEGSNPEEPEAETPPKEAEAPPKQKECGQNGVCDDAGTPKVEEANIPSKEPEEANRASPDVWRPQPPPLFDDDDDDDDDDWLK